MMGEPKKFWKLIQPIRRQKKNIRVTVRFSQKKCQTAPDAAGESLLKGVLVLTTLYRKKYTNIYNTKLVLLNFS
jgi:hypothetical protein